MGEVQSRALDGGGEREAEKTRCVDLTPPRKLNNRDTRLNYPLKSKPDGHPAGPNASLAQLVEQLTLNQRVEGSSPSGGT